MNNVLIVVTIVIVVFIYNIMGKESMILYMNTSSYNAVYTDYEIQKKIEKVNHEILQYHQINHQQAQESNMKEENLKNYTEDMKDSLNLFKTTNNEQQ